MGRGIVGKWENEPLIHRLKKEIKQRKITQRKKRKISQRKK
jgi:hypothetical protein